MVNDNLNNIVKKVFKEEISNDLGLKPLVDFSKGRVAKNVVYDRKIIKDIYTVKENSSGITVLIVKR